jgi:hypothetical protein
MNCSHSGANSGGFREEYGGIGVQRLVRGNKISSVTNRYVDMTKTNAMG